MMSSDSRAGVRPDSAEVDISIVIPAYFGAGTIADCLESVKRATSGRRSEIIVVESSGDATREIVRRRFPEVMLIESPVRLSAGGARNLGTTRARGGLIAFTDQDCIVPPDWIDQLERHLADSSVAGAGGAVGIRNPSNLSGCALYFLEFLNHFPRNGSPRRSHHFLVGCNNAYRANVLRVVQFPDQTLAEDVLFCHDLRSHGFELVYDPQIEVRHHNRAGWGEFFAYNREMGRASANYHQLLRLWWAVPFLRLPVLVYGAPAIILPKIALRLARSRWSYFFRFVMLLPMCLLGNLVWADGFRQQVTSPERRRLPRRRHSPRDAESAR
jgi:GT2 family glycosyltransferase